jgi:hypothetical protein
MYDASNKPKFEDGPEENGTPTKKLNNVINRQPSTGGQCPFSGN